MWCFCGVVRRLCCLLLSREPPKQIERESLGNSHSPRDKDCEGLSLIARRPNVGGHARRANVVKNALAALLPISIDLCIPYASDEAHAKGRGTLGIGRAADDRACEAFILIVAVVIRCHAPAAELPVIEAVVGQGSARNELDREAIWRNISATEWRDMEGRKEAEVGGSGRREREEGAGGGVVLFLVLV